MSRIKDRSQQAADIYDRMAEAYTKLFWEDYSDDPETDIFLKLLPRDGYILDAGCGPGNISRLLIAKGFSVIGVDLSAEQIRIARERVQEATFLEMDIRKLSFKDSSFDGVYSAYSLMHIPNEDVLPTLREFYRVLKPKGCLFLAAKAGPGETYLEEPLANNELCYFNFYDPKWLQSQIEEAGFEILHFFRKQPVTKGELPNEKLIYIARRP
jgi:ubiquinone/menaquinone biosynthesis C-methylase UbiE